jgi:hypothetical protein
LLADHHLVFLLTFCSTRNHHHANTNRYWRIVEEEMRVEREKAIAEAEVAAAAALERELLEGRR